jgi:hypothetical protein
MARWTKDEENFVLEHLKKYTSVGELPLIAMGRTMGRTPASIGRKATRLLLLSKNTHTYEWSREESKEAFTLYLQELSLVDTLEELHRQGSEATLDQLEQELKRLRDAWSNHIMAYAEERKLPVAKRFTLETISFYITNRLTDKDFLRKVLYGKIKNG